MTSLNAPKLEESDESYDTEAIQCMENCSRSGTSVVNVDILNVNANKTTMNHRIIATARRN